MLSYIRDDVVLCLHSRCSTSYHEEHLTEVDLDTPGDTYTTINSNSLLQSLACLTLPVGLGQISSN